MQRIGLDSLARGAEVYWGVSRPRNDAVWVQTSGRLVHRPLDRRHAGPSVNSATPGRERDPAWHQQFSRQWLGRGYIAKTKERRRAPNPKQRWSRQAQRHGAWPAQHCGSVEASLFWVG